MMRLFTVLNDVDIQDWSEVLYCKGVAIRRGAIVRCSTRALVVESAGTSHKLEFADNEINK